MEMVYKDRVEKAISNLQKRHINAQYVSNRQEALSVLLEMIPVKATVSRGDSVSLEEVGIIPALRKRNQK